MCYDTEQLHGSCFAALKQLKTSASNLPISAARSPRKGLATRPTSCKKDSRKTLYQMPTSPEFLQMLSSRQDVHQQMFIYARRVAAAARCAGQMLYARFPGNGTAGVDGIPRGDSCPAPPHPLQPPHLPLEQGTGTPGLRGEAAAEQQLQREGCSHNCSFRLSAQQQLNHDMPTSSVGGKQHYTEPVAARSMSSPQQPGQQAGQLPASINNCHQQHSLSLEIQMVLGSPYKLYI